MEPAKLKARRGCREEVSFTQCLNVCLIDDRRPNVAQDLHRVFHGTDPFASSSIRRRRYYFGDGLSEARDPKGSLVCRTRSSKARHFALNTEMATSSMGES